MAFEDLCAEHPEHAEALRRLAEEQREIAGLLRNVHPGRKAVSFFGRGRDRHGTDTEKAGSARAGDLIDDFRLRGLIASGGQGQVWEAEQISLERRVALKLVHPSRVDPRHGELLAREARAGGRLAHPGIVAVHAFGRSEGVHWIAQELVEGGWTLRDFIDTMRGEEELPRDYYREVAGFTAKLADALQAAHEAGVIHRDVKPQNVLITPQDEPKLTDFGLARITDESALSVTGEFAGTYLYMSPEQVVARRMGIDHRTDVFSLGVVFYEMLALQRPFEGDTTHQIAEKIVTWDPPDLHKLRSRIPVELAVICGKALEKRRDDRYATMAELAADIRRHLANEPILARPPGPLRRAQKWMLRNPTKSVAGLVATAAFIVIAILGIVAQQNAERADANARSASSLASEMGRRAREVLRLSALQTYDDLIVEADELWPAHPDRIGAYDSWIERMQALADLLPEFEAKRAELRANALPRSEEQRIRERESHPGFTRLASLEAEIGWREAALAQRRDGVEPEEIEVVWSAYPAEASALIAVARPLVAPEREEYGGEPLGLALACRAFEVASGEEKALLGDTLAWALCAMGRDDEALEAGWEAVQAASGEDREQAESSLSRLEEAVEAASSEEGLAAAEARLGELHTEHASLDAEVNEQRDWWFPPGQDESRWWNNQLTKLIDRLRGVLDEETGLLAEEGIDGEHGRSVAKRRALAERLREGFAPGGELAARWEEALPGIRTAYPDLELVVQMGLVPIGADPESGLWEFWHVPSGDEPVRGEDGTLEMSEESGIVLVLLLGGSFRMGAQSEDPDAHSYDPNAEEDESPVHEVELSAFFLSKYEMTQGQWERFVGHNPSLYQECGMAPTLLHPVEQVSWLDCDVQLRRLGLVLPSEAWWEYGARGGTQSVWWTGDERDSLRERKAANLADRAAARVGATWPQIEDWPELDDGYAVHAPVGSHSANSFGLYGVHGNLWEWCLDGYELLFYAQSYGLDPVSAPEGSRSRVLRGGSFEFTAHDARSANRDFVTPAYADFRLGVRPARPITE